MNFYSALGLPKLIIPMLDGILRTKSLFLPKPQECVKKFI